MKIVVLVQPCQGPGTKTDFCLKLWVPCFGYGYLASGAFHKDTCSWGFSHSRHS